MNEKRRTNKILVGLLGIALCFATMNSTAMATSLHDDDDYVSNSTGLKIASGGLTLIYFPVKTAYAALGGIVGGFAYVFGGGDEESAHAVWTPTIKGTYQITPDHLRGEEPVRFFGQADWENA